MGDLELCGHVQSPNIIQYHFMSLPGQGKGLSLPFGKKEHSFLVMVVDGLPAIVFHCSRLGGHFACKSSFVHFFAVGIVTVHFLLLWMVPVNGP